MATIRAIGIPKKTAAKGSPNVLFYIKYSVKWSKKLFAGIGKNCLEKGQGRTFCLKSRQKGSVENGKWRIDDPCMSAKVHPLTWLDFRALTQ
jgi:hypothetical protein